MDRKIVVFNVTTFSALNKSAAANKIKKQKSPVSMLVDLGTQLDIILSTDSTTEQKNKAISLLKNEDTAIYTNIAKANCETLCKKMNKLNFQDWLESSYNKKGSDGILNYQYLIKKRIVDGAFSFKNSKAVTSYTISDGTRVEFHIKWTYVLPVTYVAKNTDVYYSVSITNSGTNVTGIVPASDTVLTGGSATFTLTFAEGKSASDIDVVNGTVSGTTLTVSNVTADTIVTISDKVIYYTVDVTNSGTNVTAVTPSTASVVANASATFTLTFAEGKSSSDIDVVNGTVSGTTLTVSNVSANTTVTISDKA
jgi:hypothetical protein